ncbi:MAG: hypothetical protein VYA84_08020 [Planctomycetota bacterium]|nr:hypothetical protein [Planctomycetota bacterium]
MLRGSGSIQNLIKVDPWNLQEEDEAPSSKRLLWIAVSLTMVDTILTKDRFLADIDQLGCRLLARQYDGPPYRKAKRQGIPLPRALCN